MPIIIINEKSDKIILSKTKKFILKTFFPKNIIVDIIKSKIFKFNIVFPAIKDAGINKNKKFNKFDLLLFFDKNDIIDKLTKYSLN